MKDELEVEKAVSASLKSKLEFVTWEVQAIAVNVVLSACAELMGEFKRGEHTS